MISCNLMGGLGNMMFQIAAMKSFAKDNNSEVSFPNYENHIKKINSDTYHNPNLNYAEEYKKAFSNLDIITVEPGNTKRLDLPFFYVNLKYKDNTEYFGYFQSEKFFSHNRDFILNLFKPSSKVLDDINYKYSDVLKLKTCAIHVRRGDYLKLQGLHAVQDINYFNNAISAVGDVDKYLVFSDDLNWCKNNLIGDKFVFIEGNKDYIDLFLMSMCTHQVISNSSFSWWGAWLNNNSKKKVVAPLNWFNESSQQYKNSKATSEDIIPDSWIKL